MNWRCFFGEHPWGITETRNPFHLHCKVCNACSNYHSGCKEHALTDAERAEQDRQAQAHREAMLNARIAILKYGTGKYDE